MTETPKRSLVLILSDINEMDNTVEELDEQAQAALFDELKDKVDAYKAAIETFEDKAKRNAENAEFFQKKAKAFERLIEDQKRRMMFHMQTSGFEKLKGEMWSVRIKLNAPKVVPIATAARELFTLYGDYMKLDYKWSKKALKEALKRGDEKAKVVAELKQEPAIKFDAAISPSETKKRTKKGA